MHDLDPGPPSSRPHGAGQERREAHRVGFTGTATVHVRTHAVHCHAIDVAEGGIRLRGSWLAQPGQYARVRFRLLEHDVDALGHVAWRKAGAGGTEFAIAFSHLAPAVRAEVQAYVHSRGTEQAKVIVNELLPPEPKTNSSRVWENPPTMELPAGQKDPENAQMGVLDTLPGGEPLAEPSDEPSGEPELPDPWDDAPEAEPPRPAQPAPRPAQPAPRRRRVRHHVTMHDLWMLQVRNWGHVPSEEE